MPTAEQNKAIVHRFVDEVCNERKLAIADQLFTADHVYHDPSIPDAGRGPAGMKQVVSTYQTAFPDAHWAVEDVLAAEKDIVVTRWRGRGTHKLELQGIPATGKKVDVAGIYIQRLVNNQIAETWVVWDTLGMLQQLGVVPEMGKARELQSQRRN